jgi:ATP-dependent DNA helicase RecQ
LDVLHQVLSQYWGYSEFRPLQEEAVRSAMAGRDSLVVMPTGGGKSLCFQVPAVASDGMAVVVSPLISLMKDQVDFLQTCGVPSACIHSGLDGSEKRVIDQDIQSGALKLLYVAPERLATDAFIRYLKKVPISFFAIDEAHCISHWGHDFRPHYREMSRLKEAFDGIPIHAYTATATDPVREDICLQLGLDEPDVFVGDFDRPNLAYAVERQSDQFRQVLDKVEAHKDEAGIVYCPSRKKVEDMAQRLVEAGHNAMPYHAGMDDFSRKRNQEAFAKDEADIIVATVAFGMGIDKPNVRFVIHAGMPKSLEHYQQESGRAGRDGLPAECHLLYSKGDHAFWRRLLSDLDDEVYAAATAKLDDMNAYCTQVECRHKRLVEYFGQRFAKKNCGACDACAGTLAVMDESLTLSQQILACVRELGDVAGPAYTVLILAGAAEERVTAKGHDALPFHGCLSNYRRPDIRDWIEQLVGQGFLRKTGEYNILSLTPTGEQVLAGEAIPQLLKPAPPKPKKSRKMPEKAWEGVDRELVEVLRRKRLELAKERSVPAYIIFGDATLRDMAAKQPRSLEALLEVQGMGEKKCHDFGGVFIRAIDEFLNAEVAVAEDPFEEPSYDEDWAPRRMTKDERNDEARREAFALFADGAPLEDVARRAKLSQSKVRKLLQEYLVEHAVMDASPWLPDSDFKAIVGAVAVVGDKRTRAIHQFLDGRIEPDEIEIALTCLRNAGLSPGGA